jgi:hypothetical protein
MTEKWLQIYNQGIGLIYIVRKYELHSFWSPTILTIKGGKMWETKEYELYNVI